MHGTWRVGNGSGTRAEGRGAGAANKIGEGIEEESESPSSRCRIVPSRGPSGYTSTSARSCCEVFVTVFINFDMKVYVGHVLICRHI